ncbi:MAG TPA: SDR family NAD(P)-dependent oxidoreductase [Rhodospirillales bacterium]|nr:SDR family NAD(P)-dependent oxidoreductase [Rhodospirillales bacterium]
MRLENKVALISGGARGMGAAEARLFALEGAKVVIGDVLEEEGHQMEAQINESGRECLFVRLDVTSEANWQEAVATTVARFGKLDILVNNAGIYPPASILPRRLSPARGEVSSSKTYHGWRIAKGSLQSGIWRTTSSSPISAIISKAVNRSPQAARTRSNRARMLSSPASAAITVTLARGRG